MAQEVNFETLCRYLLDRSCSDPLQARCTLHRTEDTHNLCRSGKVPALSGSSEALVMMLMSGGGAAGLGGGFSLTDSNSESQLQLCYGVSKLVL